MPLDPTSAAGAVLQALQSTIGLRLKKQLAAVANVAALRTRVTLGSNNSSGFDEANFPLAPVTGGAVYAWAETSLQADEGVNTIQPNDRGARPGRWRKTRGTPSTSGYLKAVRIYEGDDAEQPVLERLMAMTPFVVVRLMPYAPSVQSQIPGAFYLEQMDFEIWCGSKSLRQGNAALLGSTVSAEAADDPGVLKILGDVRKVLAGSDLGLPDDVDYCYPGAARPKVQDLAEGYFVHALAVRVPVTLRFEDDDGEDVVLADPAGLLLQGQIVNPDDTLTDINPGDPDQVPTP